MGLIHNHHGGFVLTNIFRPRDIFRVTSLLDLILKLSYLACLFHPLNRLLCVADIYTIYVTVRWWRHPRVHGVVLFVWLVVNVFIVTFIIFIVIVSVDIDTINVVIMINPGLKGTLPHTHLLSHLFILIRQFTQPLLILPALIQQFILHLTFIYRTKWFLHGIIIL